MVLEAVLGTQEYWEAAGWPAGRAAWLDSSRTAGG